MHYEINVARTKKTFDNKERFVHYFATHPRSLTNLSDAIEAAKDFQKRFPESEGFKVSMSVQVTTGQKVEIPE